SIRRRISRPTVVLPQPDSPTSPSVSPRRTSNETWSTARTQAPVRWRTPIFTGKCLTRSTTSTSGVPPPDDGSAAEAEAPDDGWDGAGGGVSTALTGSTVVRPVTAGPPE